jgi:hypothetical protein
MGRMVRLSLDFGGGVSFELPKSITSPTITSITITIIGIIRYFMYLQLNREFLLDFSTGWGASDEVLSDFTSFP